MVRSKLFEQFTVPAMGSNGNGYDATKDKVYVRYLRRVERYQWLGDLAVDKTPTSPAELGLTVASALEAVHQWVLETPAARGVEVAPHYVMVAIAQRRRELFEENVGKRITASVLRYDKYPSYFDGATKWPSSTWRSRALQKRMRVESQPMSTHKAYIVEVAFGPGEKFSIGPGETLDSKNATQRIPLVRQVI